MKTTPPKKPEHPLLFADPQDTLYAVYDILSVLAATNISGAPYDNTANGVQRLCGMLARVARYEAERLVFEELQGAPEEGA